MSLWHLARVYDGLFRMNGLAILLIATAACPLLGEPADFEVSDKLAIDRLLDRYIHAFPTKDYGALKECFQTPWVGFRGPVNVLQTLDDVINTYRNELNALDESNYDHSQFTGSRIIGLSADRALVNRKYRRYRKDGTVLLETAGIYVVSKSSGKWKICGFMAQDLKEFGKVY
jgi:uncharacterized NTF2-like protein DUF6841